MSSPESERFRRVAAAFTQVVDAVPDDRWDSPAPPEGWRARDVIGHLVEWFPGLFLESWDVPVPTFPSVEDDPAGAWAFLRDTVQGLLDDPAVATSEREIRPGTFTFAGAVDMLGTSDIVMHQWDLARATGGDERLDPAEVSSLLAGMEPIQPMLEQSGQYGPAVPVPADADEQTRLIALIGRQP